MKTTYITYKHGEIVKIGDINYTKFITNPGSSGLYKEVQGFIGYKSSSIYLVSQVICQGKLLDKDNTTNWDLVTSNGENGIEKEDDSGQNTTPTEISVIYGTKPAIGEILFCKDSAGDDYSNKPIQVPGPTLIFAPNSKTENYNGTDYTDCVQQDTTRRPLDAMVDTTNNDIRAKDISGATRSIIQTIRINTDHINKQLTFSQTTSKIGTSNDPKNNIIYTLNFMIFKLSHYDTNTLNHNTTNPEPIVILDYVTLPEPATIAGWIFKGWSFTKTGQGITYEANYPYPLSTLKNDSGNNNNTLYEIWEKERNFTPYVKDEGIWKEAAAVYVNTNYGTSNPPNWVEVKNVFEQPYN